LKAIYANISFREQLSKQIHQLLEACDTGMKVDQCDGLSANE